VETEALIQKCWNTVGIAVQKGQLYDVSATAIAAPGKFEAEKFASKA
jgi:hypothetical protein